VSTFARVVFALLVGATFAAFFVAQRLKATPAVVGSVAVQKFVSPNGDGVRDTGKIRFRLKKADDVTVDVIDADGGRVRRLATAQPARPFRAVRLAWDGRTDDRLRAPDGTYRVRVSLRRQGRSVVLVPGEVIVDTKPPRPVVLSATSAETPAIGAGPPSPLVRSGERVAVRVRGAGRRKAPTFQVVRTDLDRPRVVARFTGRKGGSRAEWDGLADGAPAPPGTYLIAVSAEDRSGNVGTTPRLPAQPGEVPGRPGVTVRGLAVQPPLEPVRAGGLAEFRVDARQRAFGWRLRRLGAPRPRKRGRVRAGQTRLVIRAPEDVTAVYLLEVRSGRYGATVPFVVQSEKRAPMLVVLPAMTWVGEDRLDDPREADGVPNTLANGGPVPIPRPLLGEEGLPRGFSDDIAPLILFLERAHVPFDLTTDLALARGRDPRQTDRPAVLIAGPARWVTRPLGRRLRRYVLDGGRLASFGTGSLRRGVSLTQGRMARPTQPSLVDALGGRLGEIRRPPPPVELAPLPESRDDALLTAFDGALGGFEALEELVSPGPRARLLAGLVQPLTEAEVAEADAAGRTPREPRPALSETRVGRGLVIRIGLPGWVGRLAEDAEVAQITRNVVDLLRGVRPRPRSGPR